MIKLSERLQCVAGMVTPGHAVLDVGCDHGYIPISLITAGKAPCAVASDVRKGPLSRAEEHVKEAGLEEKVRLVCANGIPKNFLELFGEMTAADGSADFAAPVTCVIAGMGGMLMGSILTEAGDLLSQIDELILSPQSDLAHFRKTLLELSLTIAEERFLEEDGKFYTVMRCVHGADRAAWTESELLFGKRLLEARDPALRTYLTKRKRVLDTIRRQLLTHGIGAGDHRMLELETEEQKVCDALGRYE